MGLFPDLKPEYILKDISRFENAGKALANWRPEKYTEIITYAIGSKYDFRELPVKIFKRGTVSVDTKSGCYYGTADIPNQDGDVTRENFVLTRTAFPHIYAFFFITRVSTFKRFCKKCLNYSGRANVFFSQTEFERLLTDWSKKLDVQGYEVRLTLGTLKERLTHKRTGRWEKEYATSVVWTEERIKEWFGKVNDLGQYFSTIGFKVFVKNTIDKQPYLRGAISKEGVVRVNQHYHIIETDLLEIILRLGFNKYQYLIGRSRVDLPNFEIKPLKIEYEKGTLSKEGEIDRLLKCLQSIPKVNVSVLHGNPYFNVSLLDHEDGSACDLWVLDSDSILLIPQVITTESALKKIVDFVYLGYREGEIKEVAINGE